MKNILLTLDCDVGVDGVDRDEQNPLSRALQRSLRTGKPPGQLSSYFLIDNAGTLRWVGFLARSDGGRIVFHLGLTDPTAGQLMTYRRHRESVRETRDGHKFALDHVTLEPDYRSTHFTSFLSRQHSERYSTIDLGNCRYLWFGLTVGNLDALRVVRRSTIASAPSPGTDVTRRLKQFADAFEHRQSATLPCRNADFYHPGLAHIAVVVGPKGFETYKGSVLGFPEGSPFLKESLQMPREIGTSSTRISLGRTDLQIFSVWLPGELNVDFAFTGGEVAQPSK